MLTTPLGSNCRRPSRGRLWAKLEHDPEHSLLLALAAAQECAPTPPAQRALMTALAAFRIRGVLEGHERAVNAVDWSRGGDRIATASADRTARIWDASTRRQLLALPHDDDVRTVAWSPDGRQVATMSADRTARTWDARTGEQRLILRGHSEAGWGVAWSPAGDRLATSSNDNTTRSGTLSRARNWSPFAVTRTIPNVAPGHPTARG